VLAISAVPLSSSFANSGAERCPLKKELAQAEKGTRQVTVNYSIVKDPTGSIGGGSLANGSDRRTDHSIREPKPKKIFGSRC